MRPLVIHPKDPTTNFLKTIYQDMDCDVIEFNTSDSFLRKEMKGRERILIMGHGTTYGLLGPNGHMINSSHVDILRDMPNNVYIWCNADKFVEQHNLKGFYTGMFISEFEEAIIYDVDLLNESSLVYSNNLFSEELRKVINFELPLLHEAIKQTYDSELCPVIKFNNKRLYYR